ncbi:hypothetical protein BS47DRAFT_1366515 [Hydnum rufescens UP504]|uniref:Uncharacterized protein n=1 Tax=Hydnum rufescens UP504 TaxID=1448309 RepID=A0A9P6AMV4_9AGAM|nr:hypothetical protein BS47DRAFT_1366515 [Hydnum rufescens UP504]
MPKEQCQLLFWCCLLSFFYLLICSYSRDTSTSQYLTRQMNRQARGKTQQHVQPPKPPRIPPPHDTPPNEGTDSQGETWQHTQPPKIPPLDHPQHTRRQPNTAPHTHFGRYLHPAIPTRRTNRQPGYLHLVIPHPTNEQTGPGRNTAACAATPRCFNYPQHMHRRSKCSATHPLRWIAPSHDTPPTA